MCRQSEGLEQRRAAAAELRAACVCEARTFRHALNQTLNASIAEFANLLGEIDRKTEDPRDGR